ncbi:MAG: hypothetical protein QME28_05850 [Candidatus Saccharicenans sp.]|nr:hypothetical protein [Candidatus Saccharicenans sp.]
MISRRNFLKGIGLGTLGTITARHLSWGSLRSSDTQAGVAVQHDPRSALRVKPILVYSTPEQAPQTSWRAWGGIQTRQEAEEEIARIQGELAALKKKADFPLEFLPLSAVRQPADLSSSHASDIASADAIIVYAAGGWMDVFHHLEKTGRS